LVIGNPGALNVADRKGAYTIHIACKFSSVKVVKYLVDLDRDSMNNVDAKNNSPLHYACQGGSLDVAKGANVPLVSEGISNNKLLFHLLLEYGENMLDKDSMECVETVRQLLLANPEVVRDFMPFNLCR
jgi:ankyrin repeat protein